MAAFFNPVLETYKGIKIRKYNKLQIRVSSEEYKRFIDIKDEFGFSVRAAIEKKGLLCEKCPPLQITKTQL